MFDAVPTSIEVVVSLLAILLASRRPRLAALVALAVAVTIRWAIGATVSVRCISAPLPVQVPAPWRCVSDHREPSLTQREPSLRCEPVAGRGRPHRDWPDHDEGRYLLPARKARGASGNRCGAWTCCP